MQEQLPQDEILEKRIKALSGMAEGAGWDSSITSGLSEMMRLAEKRKQYESTLKSDTDFADWKRKQDYTNSTSEDEFADWKKKQDYLQELEDGGEEPLDPFVVESYVDQLVSGEIKVSNIPDKKTRDAVVAYMKTNKINPDQIQKEKDVKGLISGIDDLKQFAKDANILNWNSPFSAEKEKFNSTKGIVVQQIANMFEKGRLSDEDRKFYTNQIVGLTPFGFSGKKDAQIENLKKQILKGNGLEHLITDEDPSKALPKPTGTSGNFIIEKVE